MTLCYLLELVYSSTILSNSLYGNKSCLRINRKIKTCEGKEPSSLSNTHWLLLIICLSLSIFWILTLMKFSTSFMLCAVLKLCHTIPYLAYESVLTGDDIVNVAVVIKDVRTKERVLAAQEFNLRSPRISIKVELHPASLSPAHIIIQW